MLKHSYWIFVFFFFTPVVVCAQQTPLQEVLTDWHERFDSILQNKKQYRLQIIYTQIDRDINNAPILKTYTFDADSYYYYCASMVKLMQAPLVLEKINRLKNYSITAHDSISIPEFFCRGLNDKTLKRNCLNNTPAQLIKEMFVASNNDAFNPLYDFLTQEHFNKRLKELGIETAAICSRFAPCDSNENRQSNPVEFRDRNTGVLKFYQKSVTNNTTPAYCLSLSTLVGRGTMNDGKIIYKPKDFYYSNYVALTDLHNWLTRIIFPELQPHGKELQLNRSDYELLRKYLGMYPRESAWPRYNPQEYPDNKFKYFVAVDGIGRLPANLRIFNKVGMAYGFITDCSYVADSLNKVEFFLSVSMYVNRNEVLNDGLYEYSTTALPFMRNLFNAIYLYEVNRKRDIKPSFTDWNFTDDVY
jgi:hypothetical protein